MIWCIWLGLSYKAEGTVDNVEKLKDKDIHKEEGHYFEEHVDWPLEIEWDELQPCLRTWAHFYQQQKGLLNVVKYKVSSVTIQLLRNRNYSTSLVVVAKMDGSENPTLDTAHLDVADSMWVGTGHLWSSQCLPSIGWCASLQV